MIKIPALFVSHGSPMTLVEESPARTFFTEWRQHYEKPSAIVMVSAHWENIGGPAVSFAKRPETIHDFGGFPRELYDLQYPAQGAPQLAAKAVDLLAAAGFTVKQSATRGLDHGAWVPLMLMYPEADVPVFQVSLVHRASPEAHYRMGRALSGLLSENVLVMGSGSITHNLYEYMGHQPDDPAPGWVAGFTGWFADALTEKRLADLLDYRRLTPHAARNHPTDEHLMPLYVAMGAAGENMSAERIHASVAYGVIGMDAYAFNEA